MKLRAAALCVGAFMAVATGLAGAGDAKAQAQPTLQSAHLFLNQMLPDGATTFDGQTTSGDYSAEVRITTVISSGCETTLYGIAEDNQRRFSRSINWAKVSNVYYWRGVRIMGAIKTTNGSVIDEMVVTPAGPTTGERIATAMNFLREKCDTAANTGF